MSQASTVNTISGPEGLMCKQVFEESSFEAKNESGTTVVRGYLATKSIDKNGDRFSEEALKSIAQQINEGANATVVFPNPDLDTVDDIEEAMEQANDGPTDGDLEHQNYIGMYKKMRAIADTRAVNAFKFREAKFDGYGVMVEAELIDELPEETKSSVKGLIDRGILKGFSLEYTTQKSEKKVVDGNTIREIQAVDTKGGAVTSRPLNPTAIMTEAELKNVLAGLKAEIPDELADELGEDRFIPPETAADNARKALEWKEEYPDEAEGGEQQGTDTARMIVSAVENDEPLSPDMVEEIASFDRHREQGNHKLADEFEGEPWKDNGYLAWLLWGGDEGVDWAQRLNERMDEVMEGKSMLMREYEYKAFMPSHEPLDGFDVVEQDEWSSLDYEDFRQGYDLDEERFVDLSDEDKRLIAAHFAYVRADDIANAEFSDLVLPHHSPMNDGDVSTAGVEAARQRLPQTDEPTEVLREIDRHLMEHMSEDFGMDEVSPIIGDNAEGKSDIMSDEDTQEDESSPVDELKSEMDELKSQLDQLTEQNEELKEENEELKSQLEDVEEMKSITDDVDELKNELSERIDETRAMVEQNQTKRAKSEPKEQLKSILSTKASSERALEEYVGEYKNQLKEKYDVTDETIEQAKDEVLA